MIGLLAINFVCDTSILNTYPILLYFNEQDTEKENLVSCIIKNERSLKKYVTDKMATLERWGNAKIYAISYVTENNYKDSNERTEKYEATVSSVYKLEDNPDIVEKLITEVMSQIAKHDPMKTNNNMQMIRSVMHENVTPATVINYARKICTDNGISAKDIAVILAEIKKKITSI